MRTQRMDNGVCPLFNAHNQYEGVKEQYGSLISYEVDNGEVRGIIQFSFRPEFDGIWIDISKGIIRGISARYIPWVYSREIVAERAEPNYRAIDWEITEISLAPIPADYNSMVRSEGNTGETFEVVINNFSKTNTRSKMEVNKSGEGQQQPTAEAQEAARSQQQAVTVQTIVLNEDQIRTQATTAERQRIVDIRTAVRTAGLEESVADEMVTNNTGIDQARAQIFAKMAAKQGTPNVKPQSDASNAVAIGDEGDNIRSAMSEAILHRCEPGTVKLSDKAQEFKGMKLLDMARHMLQLKGENPFKYSQVEAVQRAISTTDYPDLLTSTVGRQLRRFFEAVNGSWQQLGTQTTVSDFRAKTGVQIDGTVTFDKIAEGGEYKSAKIIQNNKATIAVDTYGKLVKITRQAIINDDLNAFSQLPKIFAQGARNLQAKMFWDMVLNNVNTPDGVALFHATHGNLAGAGAVMNETTLNAAIVAMGLQKSPAGEEIQLAPKFLVVPIELQTLAKKLMASITSTKTTDVNPFNNAFDIISEVRLSRNSPISWYMFADPSTVEGLIYAYLDGQNGLYTESRTNFDDDSVETKARMEFGVAAWEHRGVYKNPGA